VSGQEYGVEFHHVQMYADAIKSMEEYKKLESQLNALAEKGSYDPFSGGMRFLEPVNELPARVQAGAKEWDKLCKETGLPVSPEKNFTPAGQDLVEQLIVGLGWRVTAEYTGTQTRSVLVTSQDPCGAKIVVTCVTGENKDAEEYDHFDRVHVDRFFEEHHGYQGIAVLGFELPQAGAIEETLRRYKKLHPKMLLGVKRYEDTRSVRDECTQKSKKIVLGTMTILEAFAYYKTDKGGEVDRGTVIRLVHRDGTFGSQAGFSNPQGVLPGFIDVDASFDGTSIPAYSDHWVSNVTDRHSFLSTLEDVLGFTPKVDFNAGVVAAGRAKIESTVSGNNTAKVKNTCDSNEILRDQSQVYLPINNALTDVGHVHFFLKQLGQGVQHLAARVKDLVSFIERVNNYRLVTGRGFTFLNIPPSYYGRLDVARDLAPHFGGDMSKADSILGKLVSASLATKAGIVAIDVSAEKIKDALKDVPAFQSGPQDKLVETIKCARYSNMYALLKDHFSEDTYLQIVRNKILVDIQANDVLFQIFTCNILQRDTKDESPFLEFIQRVCSEKCLPDGTCAPIKPGCGGFGIRNFLTLFLSIEVSKAMQDLENATAAGDKEKEKNAFKRVELFTKQMDESNPILTEISDAMTAEGNALEELEALKESEAKDDGRKKKLEAIAKEQCALKMKGQTDLQALSDRYAKQMQDLM